MLNLSPYDDSYSVASNKTGTDSDSDLAREFLGEFNDFFNHEEFTNATAEFSAAEIEKRRPKRRGKNHKANNDIIRAKSDNFDFPGFALSPLDSLPGYRCLTGGEKNIKKNEHVMPGGHGDALEKDNWEMLGGFDSDLNNAACSENRKSKKASFPHAPNSIRRTKENNNQNQPVWQHEDFDVYLENLLTISIKCQTQEGGISGLNDKNNFNDPACKLNIYNECFEMILNQMVLLVQKISDEKTEDLTIGLWEKLIYNMNLAQKKHTYLIFGRMFPFLDCDCEKLALRLVETGNKFKNFRKKMVDFFQYMPFSLFKKVIKLFPPSIQIFIPQRATLPREVVIINPIVDKNITTNMELNMGLNNEGPNKPTENKEVNKRKGKEYGGDVARNNVTDIGGQENNQESSNTGSNALSYAGAEKTDIQYPIGFPTEWILFQSLRDVRRLKLVLETFHCGIEELVPKNDYFCPTVLALAYNFTIPAIKYIYTECKDKYKNSLTDETFLMYCCRTQDSSGLLDFFADHEDINSDFLNTAPDAQGNFCFKDAFTSAIDNNRFVHVPKLIELGYNLNKIFNPISVAGVKLRPQSVLSKYLYAYDKHLTNYFERKKRPGCGKKLHHPEKIKLPQETNLHGFLKNFNQQEVMEWVNSNPNISIQTKDAIISTLITMSLTFETNTFSEKAFLEKISLNDAFNTRAI